MQNLPLASQTTQQENSRSTASEAFDIYVVGLGIVGIRQITREVDEVLGRSNEILYLDPGFGVGDYLRERCRRVTDLFPVSYREGEHRITAYDEMAAAVLEAALDHAPVTFAVYGHPLIYVYPTNQILRASKPLGLKMKVLPGISALDCLFIDLALDPAAQGLQMYEATDLLLRQRPLQPDVPCLLWQVGAVESALYTTAPNTPRRFERLQAYLLQYYPSDHEACAVYSSPFPLIPSNIVRFPIGEFAEQVAGLSHGATIYVPPVRPRTVADQGLLADVESLSHLRKVTSRKTIELGDV